MSTYTKVDDLYKTHLEGEVQYLLNELTETLNPILNCVEITQIVCSMLEDNITFVKKNGMGDKAKLSRERLLRLLDLTELYSSVSKDNNKLKLLNKSLLIENQQLLNYKKEVERQEMIAKSI